MEDRADSDQQCFAYYSALRCCEKAMLSDACARHEATCAIQSDISFIATSIKLSLLRPAKTCI
eukprot:6199922-Pleurochrysis_carterae.AAC.1